MSDTRTAGYSFAFDDSRYPTAFFADYEALTCLSVSASTETLHVRNRTTGGHFLAKCYWDESRSSGVTESAVLKKLNHPGIPKFVAEYQNETMLCVVREYLEGMPLHVFASESPPTPSQSVAIASEICDILAYLHRQSPPIIHRDIKPQNIIIDPAQKAWLIDFGISREYDEYASKDTACFGTVDFAPPEQYGFSQTDHRTDIFSLGVLIGWLLTGESQPRKAMPKLVSPRLQKIVKTCTELTPDRRYASVQQVKKALQRADGHVQKRIFRVVCCLVASITCLSAGFWIGRYTGYTPALFAPKRVSFEEPLIEQAVRRSLGLDQHTPISEDDLLSVTELYIFGNRASLNPAEYAAAQQGMGLQDASIRNGGIRSVQDLTKLKHLKIIRIALQDVSDLSPLANLPSLEFIDLNHNPIEDITPLASLYSLRELCVFDSRVSDCSALSSCPLLETIDAGKTRVTSLEAFAEITGLKCLKLRNASLATLDGIGALSGLEQLELTAVRDGNLAPLLTLPLLNEVFLSESLREEAARDLPDAAFRITFF
jgi:serine/threonine protein kinase